MKIKSLIAPAFAISSVSANAQEIEWDPKRTLEEFLSHIEKKQVEQAASNLREDIVMRDGRPEKENAVESISAQQFAGHISGCSLERVVTLPISPVPQASGKRFSQFSATWLCEKSIWEEARPSGRQSFRFSAGLNVFESDGRILPIMLTEQLGADSPSNG